MNIISLGLGRSAALLLGLGFASSAVTVTGNYITLGYAESAQKVVTLGLGNFSAPASGGSYITLGQGQTASLFAMLGLRPGVAVPPPDEVPPPPIAAPFPPHRFQIPDDLRAFDDDEIFMWVIAAAVSTGMLK